MLEINGFALTQLFIRNSSLSGSAYAVSIILADRYDSRKGYSSISSRVIAQTAGLSTKTVITALAEIEESGEWTSTKLNGAATRYYPVLDKVITKQEKTKQESKRGVSLRSKNVEHSETTAAESDLVPEKKKPSELPEQALIPVAVSSQEDEYPNVDEDTDPCLDGLPLMDGESAAGTVPNVVRPSVLSSPLAMAVRLHRRTEISTRINKKDFTVPKLEELIKDLGKEYPLEAIDILLWRQCENREPLNPRFLGLVLKKCVANGEIVPPERWDTNKADPAYDVANEVFTIFSERHSLDVKEYVTYL